MAYSNVQEYFRTDSMTTLAYTCIRNRFHIFVGNRVQTILSQSSASQWRYVPTSCNPADDASRGLDLSKIDNNHR